MRLYAPAKINWTLEVLGRRDDGYHEVRTVMQTMEPCDTLDISADDELRLEVEGRQEAPKDDLALRAAALLSGGSDRGARIRLRKRIPVAAGLGGGSSDAAAVLRGLNELWGLGHGEARLAELGAALGSDVPFFVFGGAGLGEGRGERVTALPDGPPMWLVLLAPPFELAEKTARMYSSLSAANFSDGSRAENLATLIRAGKPIDEGYLYNTFERVAYDAFEGLADYREALVAAGARGVHMAGSGPALYALGPDEAGARAMHERLRAPGGESMVVRTLKAAEARVRQG